MRFDPKTLNHVLVAKEPRPSHVCKPADLETERDLLQTGPEPSAEEIEAVLGGLEAHKDEDAGNYSAAPMDVFGIEAGFNTENVEVCTVGEGISAEEFNSLRESA